MSQILSRLEDIFCASAFTDAGEFGKALDLLTRHLSPAQGDVLS